MPARLLDYASLEFPGREIDRFEGPGPEAPLHSHTLVVHVDRPAAHNVIALVRSEVGEERVGSVVARHLDRTITPQPTEDRDGTTDLPPERLVLGVGAGALVGAVLGVVVGLLGSTHWGAALALGAFGTVVGAVVGVLLSGGARYAGERAVDPTGSSGKDTVIVAALLDDEADATELASTVAAQVDAFESRIVGIDGRWRAPGN